MSYPSSVNLRVLSLSTCLYQANVVLDHTEFVLCANDGAVLKAASLGLLAKKLISANIHSAVLVHSSPYDEMIGLSSGDKVAALEVPLDWQGLCKITQT